jgi:hypothetical protein
MPFPLATALSLQLSSPFCHPERSEGSAVLLRPSQVIRYRTAREKCGLVPVTADSVVEPNLASTEQPPPPDIER